jgi:hypothetical protein
MFQWRPVYLQERTTTSSVQRRIQQVQQQKDMRIPSRSCITSTSLSCDALASSATRETSNGARVSASSAKLSYHTARSQETFPNSETLADPNALSKSLDNCLGPSGTLKLSAFSPNEKAAEQCEPVSFVSTKTIEPLVRCKVEQAAVSNAVGNPPSPAGSLMLRLSQRRGSGTSVGGASRSPSSSSRLEEKLEKLRRERLQLESKIREAMIDENTKILGVWKGRKTSNSPVNHHVLS